ncbi:21241_t:CDS:2, partial [Cetraspora pellucida]
KLYLTELEACENNLDGIEINIRVVLPTADGYKWNYLRQYNNVSKKLTRWYTCSLSSQHDHSKQNPKHIYTKQERFTCQGLVRIIFNLEKMIVHLYICHYELHLCPTIKENVDKKVIEFIKNNIHLTLRQLWKQLQYQSHTLTQKQVHFWWTMFYQKLYLRDDDQFISTTYLLQEDENYLLLYSNQENGIFEIAFTTSFL